MLATDGDFVKRISGLLVDGLTGEPINEITGVLDVEWPKVYIY